MNIFLLTRSYNHNMIMIVIFIFKLEHEHVPTFFHENSPLFLRGWGNSFPRAGDAHLLTPSPRFLPFPYHSHSLRYTKLSDHDDVVFPVSKSHCQVWPTHKHHNRRFHFMNIGSSTPPWRIPMFINGTLTFSALSFFRGQPLVLCCPSLLTAQTSILLEAQINSFHDRNTRLAAFVSRDTTHNLPWNLPSSEFRLPLLTDPLNRLSRALGLSRNLVALRCETLFFDGNGRLEFRLIHDLNHSGITRVLEVTERLFSQDTHKQRIESCHDLPVIPSNLEEVGLAATTQPST